MHVSPILAIIVPIFKHSGLLPEALEAILAQETQYTFVVILVDDQCPHQETREICQNYTTQYPGQFYYLRRNRNGGLAAARNTGVEFVLNTWNDIKYVMFFDADDRAHTKLVERGVSHFRKADHSRIGWLYEDPAQFGIDHHYIKPHEYSVMWHLLGNACQSTSMINANVFRKGLRYDESMRAGSEDWEFWIRCISNGYRGEFCEHMGYGYRWRPESMVAGAARSAESNMQYIRFRNPTPFKPRQWLEYEQEESPRYLFIDSSTMALRFSDPDKAEGINLISAADEIARNASNRLQARPASVIFSKIPLAEFEGLKQIIRFILWKSDVKRNAIVEWYLEGDESYDFIDFSANPAAKPAREPDVRAVPVDALDDKNVRTISFGLKWPTLFNSSVSMRDCQSVFMAAYSRAKRQSASQYYHRNATIWIPRDIDRAKGADFIHKSYPLYPLVKKSNICVIWDRPYGPDEEVLTKITGTADFTLACRATYVPEEWTGDIIPLDAVTFMSVQEGTEWDIQASRGLFSAFDVVVNCGSEVFHKLAGDLRRNGSRTIALIPADERESDQKALIHSLVPYSHAYDEAITVEESSFSLLAGLGFPEDNVRMVI